MAAEQDPKVESIAQTASACLEALNRCLKLEHNTRGDSTVHSYFEDQIGRFSIWSSSIGAFAPRRASLDYRLRMVPDVQRLVRGLLQTLNDHLQAHLSHASQSSLYEDPPGTVMASISKDISLLHRLSNTIRNASRESQNLRAATDFTITDEEGNDVGIIFRDLFAGELIARKFPSCSETLRQRLASAMLLRRKRILYRRSRHGHLVERHELSDTANTMDKGDVLGTRSGVGSRATTVSPEQFKKASSRSVVTRATTLRLGHSELALFPPAPKARLIHRLKPLDKVQETEWRISDTGGDSDARIANNHKERDEEDYEIICPYCCCTLLNAEILDANKWRNHVKHDLDAYVCLFDDCTSADTLYNHSDEWLKHMRGHKMRWRCTAKAHGTLSFHDQDEYLDHVRTKHKASELQLQFLSTSNVRSSGPVFDSCPLCGKSELNMSIDGHVATHLRELALVSLPFIDDDGDDASDNMSSVDNGGSRSTINEGLEYDSPWEFEDHGPNHHELRYISKQDDIDAILSESIPKHRMPSNIDTGEPTPSPTLEQESPSPQSTTTTPVTGEDRPSSPSFDMTDFKDLLEDAEVPSRQQHSVSQHSEEDSVDSALPHSEHKPPKTEDSFQNMKDSPVFTSSYGCTFVKGDKYSVEMYICCQCGDGPKVWANQPTCVVCQHQACAG
ncbi:hypothetical protein BJY01DRAFT_215324 [Aspergillus pseudoustus]|uniref:C2H2-type domain-containing protein n=1 Tax=Aspergillus pseudoustus TaxID=1810923 RepID=A0ABR4JV53_9EURO